MIVDLVRNDLSQCAVTGSVHTVALLEVEQHPGLVQLVSKIEATLIGGTEWSDLFSATFPPGSVTGAPKISALEIIRELEPEPRSFYCGAFGWIDAENKTAQLAVAIRTFCLIGASLNLERAQASLGTLMPMLSGRRRN